MLARTTALSLPAQSFRLGHSTLPLTYRSPRSPIPSPKVSPISQSERFLGKTADKRGALPRLAQALPIALGCFRASRFNRLSSLYAKQDSRSRMPILRCKRYLQRLGILVKNFVYQPAKAEKTFF
ncbi:hypothetical protein MPNT_130036 [Candidatus Methylacidithermus pantelleriae]|uniref:Uncharacterized protein n=1 Tax=Candidatus Methylacidithermus pantelleriae TaxID=2744239 RepID=A0A8J2BLF0_9BACT|nr:hypothetical protein MPNT_130036 [Candidatus Methylacidithermus pantelleriae]